MVFKIFFDIECFYNRRYNMMHWILNFLFLGVIGTSALSWLGYCARNDLMPVKVPLILFGLLIFGLICNGACSATEEA
jgi:hypothetical protein